MEQDPNTPTRGEEEPESPGRPAQRDISRSVSVLESLLLVSSQPLPFDRIGQLLGGLSKQEVREVVQAVQSKYSTTGSGILVEEVAKGLQLRTNPANQEFVRKLFETRPQRFSRPSLRVMHRQQLDRGDAERGEVRDHGLGDQAEVGSALGLGHLGVPHGHALHVALVDDRPAPGRARRAVVVPGRWKNRR